MKLKKFFLSSILFLIIAGVNILPVLAADEPIDINIESEMLTTDQEVAFEDDDELLMRDFWGTITANNVNFRKTPGLSGAIIRQLHKGYQVQIPSIADGYKEVDGYGWRLVRYEGVTGWVVINFLHEGG